MAASFSPTTRNGSMALHSSRSVLFIILGLYGGMIPAIFGCVFVCALGDNTATYKSSAILAAGVTVFGVLLFHYLLGIRFRCCAGEPVISTAITDLWYGFGVALEPHNLMYCFLGVLVGNLVGVLPGDGPRGDDFYFAAADLRDAAGAGDPDAVRGLLWRPIWRRDLFDPVDPALSSASRRDLPRRFSAHKARQGRHPRSASRSSPPSSAPRSASPR